MWHVVEPPLDATEVVPAKGSSLGKSGDLPITPKEVLPNVLCGVGNGISNKWWCTAIMKLLWLC